jgi:hypothetical protein
MFTISTQVLHTSTDTILKTVLTLYRSRQAKGRICQFIGAQSSVQFVKSLLQDEVLTHRTEEVKTA